MEEVIKLAKQTAENAVDNLAKAAKILIDQGTDDKTAFAVATLIFQQEAAAIGKNKICLEKIKQEIYGDKNKETEAEKQIRKSSQGAEQ